MDENVTIAPRVLVLVHIIISNSILTLMKEFGRIVNFSTKLGLSLMEP